MPNSFAEVEKAHGKASPDKPCASAQGFKQLPIAFQRLPLRESMACHFRAVGFRPPHHGPTREADVKRRCRQLSLAHYPDRAAAVNHDMQVFVFNDTNDLCNSVCGMQTTLP